MKDELKGRETARALDRQHEAAHFQESWKKQDGDLALIRWMLDKSPLERLQALQGFVSSIWKMRDAQS